MKCPNCNDTLFVIDTTPLGTVIRCGSCEIAAWFIEDIVFPKRDYETT